MHNDLTTCSSTHTHHHPLLWLYTKNIVALASHRGHFCIVNVRSNEGHAILDQWQSSSDQKQDQEQEHEMQYEQEVLEMQFCARTGQFWTLERNTKRGELDLVCYKDAGGKDDRPRRMTVPVSSTEATMSVSRNGTVTLSLAGGIIEFWHCRMAGGALQRMGQLELTAVLGIRCVSMRCIYTKRTQITYFNVYSLISFTTNMHTTSQHTATLLQSCHFARTPARGRHPHRHLADTVGRL